MSNHKILLIEAFSLIRENFPILLATPFLFIVSGSMKAQEQTEEDHLSRIREEMLLVCEKQRLSLEKQSLQLADLIVAYDEALARGSITKTIIDQRERLLQAKSRTDSFFYNHNCQFNNSDD